MTNSWLRAALALSLALLASSASAAVDGKDPRGIPWVRFGSDELGSYPLGNVTTIIVDSKFANATDQTGETLIPPTLYQFATTFASDLGEVFQKNISVALGDGIAQDSIFLTILTNSWMFVDAVGRHTAEGYFLDTDSRGVIINAASPLGAWWGTRTVLQQAVLHQAIPISSAEDMAAWSIRGMMLDAGRHFYPPSFLTDLCAYMSFFKQNTLHLHISDNLYNNVDIYSRERSLGLYARFRLWSDDPAVSGLNKYKNESYTREEFDAIQSSCAARGVTIIPEIEAPGHALPIVQWKPELGRSDDLSLLNISHPDTIPTMKTIWKTFLPWFHSKTVHIGADEYTGPVDDYNTFVNSMAEYIGSFNRSIRIWGTFPPKSNYTNIYQNVSIQHWEYFEDNPLTDYIKNNYTVINSDDTFYVVNKWSGSYPQTVPYEKTFTGNPDNNSSWYPPFFDTRNSSNNPGKREPLVPGSIVPLWNDYGPNASTYSEAYWALKKGIPALADKQWGSYLPASDFEAVFANLSTSTIPGQNLERRITSWQPTIFNYTTEIPGFTQDGQIQDIAGNDYQGAYTCPLTSSGAIAISSNCSLTTPLSSKGRNYTLSLSLTVSNITSRTNATLIYGADSSLMLTPTITLFTGGNHYRLNSSLPIGKPTTLDIMARGNQTFANVDGKGEEEFKAMLGINGASFVWAPIAIEAPLRRIGGRDAGWKGEVRAWSLSSGA